MARGAKRGGGPRRDAAGELRPSAADDPRRAPDDAPPPATEHALERRIAELEASNAALRADAERMRLILESATDYAIYTVDSGGAVTSWNTGARRVLGYEEAEVLGRSGDLVFTPEDRASGVPATERRLAAERGRAANERWHVRKDGGRFWASGLSMPVLNGGARPEGFLVVLRDRTEARMEVERRELLLAELNHRVKNTLAVVQSVAAQTARQTESADAFRLAFQARLMALARSHDMLTDGGWEGAALREVVQRTLAAHGEAPARFGLSGPPVRLAPAAVVTLNLAFHELATNAAKHGALSAPGGRVEVGWALVADEGGDSPALVIAWKESGGPPVRPPERRGFGLRLIERGLPQEFGAAVSLRFAPSGVECRIRLPVAEKIIAP